MLLDVSLQLIAEHGPRGFSVAEASRRAGVSAAAPYRHFADREALLAAVAVRSYTALSSVLLTAQGSVPDPSEQLVRVSAAYVRFAVQEPSSFAVLFGSGIDKAAHPDLAEAAQGTVAAFVDPARRIVTGRDDAAALALATSLAATAHGFASLLADGALGPPAESVDHVVEQVERTVRAVLRGRRVLAP
jgi:AcrR family transcriptional regulator